ncbi:C protein [Mount Mabu Lophuromys virus 1]|uniref:C protein n=1 Tax=Mount Mabu Lophuromys virus 1 TaxID=2116559 RepID=A0A2P1GJ80_9MONO|nr:C protein [Mount Mabu Lophuromys virus 1]AVM86014.1 C protein [Mount Mabu Lophuromys virus 1]
MAFKLSSLFKAIGMRSRRRTDEVPLVNQGQKKEQQPGKLILSQRMDIPKDREGEEKAKRVILRAAAEKAIQILDRASVNHPYQKLIPGNPPAVEITKEGMMRILLNSIVEQGMTVDEKATEMVEEGLLSGRELIALKEAIPLTRLMMVIMIGYVC